MKMFAECCYIDHSLPDEVHPSVILLEGARQVGKTTLINHVLDMINRPSLRLNLEEYRSIAMKIDKCADFERLLSVEYSFKGDGQRLLFIDKAQESRYLGNFIRFMKEKWIHTPVILSGSSMSRMFKHVKRFPVGRLKRFHLQPFSYREFLRLLGKEELLDIKDFFSVSDLVHSENLKMLQQYFLVGGLPAVIEAYKNDGNWKGVREDLFYDYKSDFERIFSEKEANLLELCLQGVSNNLGSQSLYSQIVKTTSSLYRSIPEILGLLENWKLIHKLTLKSGRAEQPAFAPKRYLYDLGMAQQLRLCTIPVIDIINQLNTALRTPLGGLMENMLANELVFTGQKLTGWKRGQNSFEADFLYETADGGKIPVECKASLREKSRHLNGLLAYAEEFRVNRIVLVNLARPVKRNLAGDNLFLSIPLYLASELPALLDR